MSVVKRQTIKQVWRCYACSDPITFTGTRIRYNLNGSLHLSKPNDQRAYKIYLNYYGIQVLNRLIEDDILPRLKHLGFHYLDNLGKDFWDWKRKAYDHYGLSLTVEELDVKTRLEKDLIRISDQIGIDPQDRPKLVTSVFEIQAILSTRERAKDLTSSIYGLCDITHRTIFVNIRLRQRVRIREKYFKLEEVRAEYSDYLHTLAHELVHYRFEDEEVVNNEGKEQEERVQEILRGKTFPKKRLYSCWWNGRSLPPTWVSRIWQ